MRVLVVGGLGSIGYTLCCQLIEEEIDVFALDTISNEHIYKEERLLQIGRNAFFQFNSLDTNYRTEEDKFDVIFYCLYDPTDSQNTSSIDDRLERTKTHLKHALDYCHEYGSKFILISSTNEFDDHLTETEKKVRHDSDDGDANLYFIQEQLVTDSFKDKDEQFIILRFVSGDSKPRKGKSNRAFYLNYTKDKTKLQIITSSRDTGENSIYITKWLKNSYKKED